MNPEKKIRKIVFKHLLSLQKAAIDSAKNLDLKAIPPPILKECIKRGKCLPTQMPEFSREFVQNYNKMLDDLYDNCTEYAQRMGAERIPFDYLISAIGVIQKAFVKGQEAKR